MGKPLLLILILLLGTQICHGEAASHPAPTDRPERLVSLAPSITECLFASGAGERVVGVTRFCNWPSEAASLPRVGGYLDLSVESVIRLEPDLVLMLEESAESAAQLRRLGIPCLLLSHNTLDGLFASLDSLQLWLGEGVRADSLKRTLQGCLECFRLQTSHLSLVKTALCVGRNPAPGVPHGLYMSGNGSYLSEMLDLLGARNVYASSLPAVPQVERESLYHLQPDVLIELAPGTSSRSTEELQQDWYLLEGLHAVTHGRVYVLDAPALSIPGPRLPLALHALAECLHPEINWEEVCP